MSHPNAIVESTPERWRFIAERQHDPTSGAEPTVLYIECVPGEGCRLDFPLVEAREDVRKYGSKAYLTLGPYEEDGEPK
ncbi:MAG: hypothetical protein H6739_29990 [Alphaproteobacteria bacterium]|nr:hypothetical protein [Alphaproteobacteria bacterium]